NPVAAQAATGTGMGPSAVGYVLGICKAYTTRVGQGPFPTEQDNELGRRIGERGREFGTNTGRPRRCGWFDAVLVRQTVRTCGIDGLALTKLDILDGFEEIKVCTGYRLDGREIDYLPASEHAQARVEPVYETIAGWQEKTAGARSFAELPAPAIKYVRRIEELVGCPWHCCQQVRNGRTQSSCAIRSKCNRMCAASAGGVENRWPITIR